MILSYYKKNHDHYINIIDWISLLMAFFAILSWYFTSNALYAVIILTFVDLIGYIPMIKKSYYRPYEEKITFYFILTIRSLFAIIATNIYSMTNILFNMMIIIANLIFIIMIFIRRKILPQ
jgi:hypothetical protein